MRTGAERAGEGTTHTNSGTAVTGGDAGSPARLIPARRWVAWVASAPRAPVEAGVGGSVAPPHRFVFMPVTWRMAVWKCT